MALLEDYTNGRIRRERVFRDHDDFLAHDDEWLISRFRFPRAVLLDLCAELGPVLERATRWNHAIPVQIQVHWGCWQPAVSSRKWQTGKCFI